MKRLVFRCLLFTLVCTPVRAIVTSDGPETHVVSQLSDTFGVNLDGVALIGTLYSSGPSGFCSGSLITDKHVLTTARCFDIDGDLQIDERILQFPSEVLMEVSDQWIAVPYDPAEVVWSDDWGTSGSGLAIITLDEVADPGLPRYALFAGNNEVGQPFVLSGYGLAGFGATGIDPTYDAIRNKRVGLNRYDMLDVNVDAEFLVADFDSGKAAHNSLGDLGFGDDEVLAAPYDSGGPGFLEAAIASVTAYGSWIPDVDAIAPSKAWERGMRCNSQL